MSDKVLFITIGTGRATELEESLYQPILTSIATDDWSQVKLLPSRETITHAGTIRDRVSDIPVEVHPLPVAKAENDPDACFEHFDRMIADTLAAGYRQADCVADITRGTKAMSAALALAAVRHDVPILRYLSGIRDAAAQGTVLAGSEEIVNARTQMVTTSRRLDAARGLFERGNFSAVGALLDQGGSQAIPDSLRSQINAVKTVADFCAAWDRLDYVSAAERAPDIDALTFPHDWTRHVPTAASVDWVKQLAAGTKRDAQPDRCEDSLRKPEHFPDMARHVGRLCADLIANARRRVAQAQYEDAALRVYRVTELIGQAALFAKDYDSEFMPLDDDLVNIYINKNKRRKDLKGIPEDATHFKFGRENNAKFLKFFNDALGQGLFDFGNNQEVKSRNDSLLIHGFKATGPGDAEPLKAHLDTLANLLRQAFPDAADGWLNTAAALPPAQAEL